MQTHNHIYTAREATDQCEASMQLTSSLNKMVDIVVWAFHTDEKKAAVGEVRPLEYGVEDFLVLIVQLVHLIQHQQNHFTCHTADNLTNLHETW